MIPGYLRGPITRWRMRRQLSPEAYENWLIFGCPPHDLGSEQHTAFGIGRKCRRCHLWQWSETDEEFRARDRRERTLTGYRK